MFRAWLIGNIHDQPEMLAKLYEKVDPIFLKSILVKFSGLAHSYRAFRAGKILVRSNKGSNGRKRDQNFSNEPSGVRTGIFFVWS